MTAIDIVLPTGEASEDQALLDRLRDYLARQEATNTIQLSGFHVLPALDPGEKLLVALHGGEIVGVATLTPPFNLLLSHIEHDAAIPALAAWARQLGWQPPGVLGPHGTALAFANAWRDLTGQQARPGMAQRILATSTVRHPPGVPGRWRLANDADAGFLRAWFVDFVVEADLMPGSDAVAAADSLLKDHRPGTGNLLWLDAQGTPVSIARYKAPTSHGVRIGPVYTPPEHRRRGYGGAVTAAATQLMLDKGFAFVCLYTDAANPTSNHIYEEIGYRFVADSMQYRFEATSEDEGQA
jgi:predicted GNAT family acetyltransferase